MIDVTCDNCGRVANVEESWAGKRGRCTCGKTFRVPSLLVDPGPANLKATLTGPARGMTAVLLPETSGSDKPTVLRVQIVDIDIDSWRVFVFVCKVMYSVAGIVILIGALLYGIALFGGLLFLLLTRK